ncbi:MAG: penicillin acylase family protein [Gemmatimonadota bacterium]
MNLRTLVALLGLHVLATGTAAGQDWQTADAVEIRRTRYGVPHVRAADLRGVAFGLAYAEAEDHGARIFEALLRARGRMALRDGTPENVESDFQRRRQHARAGATWEQLRPDVREMMEGFAAGVEHYLALHPEEVLPELERPITGVDVHALYIGWYDTGEARDLVRTLEAGAGDPPPDAGDADPSTQAPAGPPRWLDDGAGSNAWAFAPERTKTQRAILLRNPHLSWDAGYYEAHLTVPGVLDFYGDFRVGSLFGIIGGFNRALGWTTTNNAPDLTETYRIRKDPAAPRHYLLDGVSYPMRSEDVSVEIRDDVRFASSGGIATELRTFWTTHVGPVIHETADEIYVMRSADDGEFRRGEQFLDMMKATSLDQWLAAMREQRISSSNYTYADRDGNIFYVWNAKLPRLPHPWTRDEPVLATRSADLWSEVVRFDRLPQLKNPAGGYVRNENDPPYWTNLDEPLPRERFPENMPDPRLRLRSQLSLQTIAQTDLLDLEDVVALKHTPRMLLADRVKDDLVAAVRLGDASDAARAAANLLRSWDNTASVDSRGSVLFALWFERYLATTDSAHVFRESWSEREPTATPHGIGDARAAVRALEWAVEEAVRRWGDWDVTWGDVHRVRHGAVDVPVAGCGGELGCFRVLNFREDPDGRRAVRGGDGWVLAVEFGQEPRAYSVLAYGQSSREGHPHHDDQAALFARGELKPVAFSERDVAQQTVARYAPGREAR